MAGEDAMTDRWPSRADYDPDAAVMEPPVGPDRFDGAAVVELAQHFKDIGVYDLPRKVELLEKAVDFLKVLVAQKDLTFKMPETATLTVAKVEVPQQVNVPDVGKSVAEALLPVLKAISSRPEQQLVFDSTAIAREVGKAVSRHEPQPPDLAPLVKALTDGQERQATLLRKALRRIDARSKVLEQQCKDDRELVRKALASLAERPTTAATAVPAEPKRIVSKHWQNEAGEWLTETAPEGTADAG